MLSLPKVDKFKGDNQQSFQQWILMFEAQLTVLGGENDRKREMLLCLLEGDAFSSAARYIATNGTATYAQLKAELEKLFRGIIISVHWKVKCEVWFSDVMQIYRCFVMN